MRRIERVLVQMDEGPPGAGYRVAVGGLAPLVWVALTGRASGWGFAGFFVAVLVGLRTAPAILRKLLPFSEPVVEAWAARRMLAKRYDSYQWRKLFWLGCGLAGFATISAERFLALEVVAAVCLVSGAAGTIAWRIRSTGASISAPAPTPPR